MSSGSASRPLPIQPHARYPAPGSTKRTPRAASVARLACTAGCSSMLVFIAGAISTGARVARYNALRKSSAMPAANLPMMLAVAGATSSRRDVGRERDVLDVGVGARATTASVITRRLVIASKVTSPTNRRADRVITAATSWPRFCNPRATSTAL